MQQITIYDEDNIKIEALADEHGTTDAEIVQAILEALYINDIDIEDYI